MKKIVAAILPLIFSLGTASAQDYPSKPVRMSELLGQPVVIDNRPGATGTVAAGQVAKSSPDGYTLMMGHVSVNAIAIAAAVPHLVTVHPSLPVNSLRELVSYLKGQPGKLTFPSAGNGSMPHPGGQHLVAFDTMPASSPHVRSGKLRALAVSSAGRVASFPEVPTAEEAGLPGDQVTTWYGLFAPAGTPPAIVRRLHAAAVSALVRSDTERYARIVKDIGLRID